MNFNDIKMSHKLIGSYAAIILLVLCLSVFSFFSMLKLGNVFSEYRGTARESLLLADMSQYLGDARRNVFKFRLMPTEENRDAVTNSIAKLIETEQGIDEIVVDQEHKEKLYSLKSQVSEYQNNFQSAIEYQAQRDRLVATMDKVGPATRKKITQIMETAYRDNDPIAAYYAGIVQQHLLLGRYYGRDFLLRNQEKDAERALSEINQALAQMDEMVAELQNPTRRQLASQVVDGLNLYKNTFRQVIDTITSRNTHYAAMDRLGPVILNAYVGLFEDNETKQNTLGPVAASTITSVKTSTVAAGIIIPILAVIVALFMARLIVGALSNVTNIMNRLRQGDFTVEVTGTERGDEIGDMAKSIAQLKDDAEKSFLLKQMVDDMPTNVMTVDVRDNLKVNYINNTSINTLSTLEDHLPVKATEILGQSIDIFHKDPEHQRRMLANPDNLPHRAKIQVGPEKMALLISAIRDKQDNYVGAMLTWDIITAKEAITEDVTNVVSVVTSAVTELEATAQSMSSMAQQTQSQSTAVAAAAEEASTNVSTVASSAEELNASITEISQQMQEASRLAQSSQEQATSTNATVGSLKEAADKIGAVVNLINDIAEQTNLLALNATIEAARAGDAGKGFAVVANEVKALANETAKATEDINKQIQHMQSVTGDAVTSISGISESVNKLSDVATSVASAVEEQNSATQEIARSVEQAAIGTREVTEKITSVSDAADETGNSSKQVLETAQELATQANSLQEKMQKFRDS